MTAKAKSNKEAQVLELLKLILPKTIPDPKLVEKVYSACESEIKSRNRVVSFDKFCERCPLPNLEPETLAQAQQLFDGSFGADKVTLTPDAEKQQVKVELNMPDAEFSAVIKVRPVEAEEEEQEIKLKYVACPVALPTDPELVWIMAKKENMTSQEASIVLTKVQDDFWGSKTGQKLLRDRVERTFAEFVRRVPAKLLNEVGLKRHYKEPEVLKQLDSAVMKVPKGKAVAA